MRNHKKHLCDTWVLHRCSANTYSSSAGSTSCSACPSSSTTNSLTGATTCSCPSGGSTITTGGYSGNGVTGSGLVCTGMRASHCRGCCGLLMRGGWAGLRTCSVHHRELSTDLLRQHWEHDLHVHRRLPQHLRNDQRGRVLGYDRSIGRRCEVDAGPPALIEQVPRRVNRQRARRSAPAQLARLFAPASPTTTFRVGQRPRQPARVCAFIYGRSSGQACRPDSALHILSRSAACPTNSTAPAGSSTCSCPAGGSAGSSAAAGTAGGYSQTGTGATLQCTRTC